MEVKIDASTYCIECSLAKFEKIIKKKKVILEYIFKTETINEDDDFTLFSKRANTMILQNTQEDEEIVKVEKSTTISDEHVYLDGNLSKLGEKIKNWKLRYFQLTDTGLKYYEKKTTKNVRFF
jgi:hypothetical protein